MAVVKAVNSRASIGRAVNYVTRTEKTEERLISGIECSPQNAIEEMKATKALWGKEEGRQYKHFVHSFPPGEKITPEQAHELAWELCQNRFKGYEVLIATHKDKDHIHSHIIVNSVSYEDGRKLHLSKGHLEQMKRDCITQSQKHGLSVPVKGKEITSNRQSQYKAIERAITGEYKSYVLDTRNAVAKARSAATSREDFIARMEQQGYTVKWTDSVKHITFTNKDGKSVRAANLEKTFKEGYTKEELDRGFEINAERAAVYDRARQQLQQPGEPDKGTDRPVGAGAGEEHGADLNTFRKGIEDSRNAVAIDDAARADRIADRESQQREQDRELEREIERASRQSPGISR